MWFIGDAWGIANTTPATPDASNTELPTEVPATIRSILRNIPALVWRTIAKAWNDGIFGMSAQAAFWQTLSLPPLLLGVLGSVGYVGNWFGTGTSDTISHRIISFASRTFNDNVVNEFIAPTVNDVLARGRGELISLGFVLSLWSGSSAMASFVDSINKAHDQHDVRHAVWQRIFALNLYVAFLVIATFILPLVALGPGYIEKIVPDSWDPYSTQIIAFAYYPAVAILLILGLSALYRVALPRPLPWHRLLPGAVLAGLVFWVASAILRVYLGSITKTGYSYGALATPIAFLLFTFFLGFAIVIGAQLNAAIQATWPTSGPTHIEQVRDWVTAQTTDITDQLRSVPRRFNTGPLRRPSADTEPASTSQRDQPSPATHSHTSTVPTAPTEAGASAELAPPTSHASMDIPHIVAPRTAPTKRDSAGQHPTATPHIRNRRSSLK